MPRYTFQYNHTTGRFEDDDGNTVGDMQDDDERRVYVKYKSGEQIVETEYMESSGYECDECGKEFDTEKGLHGHKSVHS